MCALVVRNYGFSLTVVSINMYKTSAVYSAKEKSEYKNMHAMNSAGSYIVEPYYAVPKVGRLCFDATERFHHLGWYINGVARGGNAV